MADNMAAVKHYNWLLLINLLILRHRFFTELCEMTAHISFRKFDTNPITDSKMADKFQDGGQKGDRETL